jgi:hypothetical protein
MKNLQKSLLALTLCSLPLIAYAATKNVRVTVDNQPTNYRAMVIDGTTYIALRDVADLTGKQVTYNARRGVVNITGGSNTGGGTTQRSGNEGPKGQFLTIPEASLRVDGVTNRKQYGSDWTTTSGMVRNTSNSKRTYHVRDAVLVLKDGQQIPKQTSAADLGGGVYAKLERGEEVRMNLDFKGSFTAEDIDRVVITLSVGEYSGGPYKVFRVKF